MLLCDLNTVNLIKVWFVCSRRVKYTRNVSGLLQTAQCSMVNLLHHTGLVQQVYWVVGTLETGRVEAAVQHVLCVVIVFLVVHLLEAPHQPLPSSYPHVHAVFLPFRTLVAEAAEVHLRILLWSHAASNHAAQLSHLHPKEGPSDHRVATTGRPLPQGLSDYVARQVRTISVMVNLSLSAVTFNSALYIIIKKLFTNRQLYSVPRTRFLSFTVVEHVNFWSWWNLELQCENGATVNQQCTKVPSVWFKLFFGNKNY